MDRLKRTERPADFDGNVANLSAAKVPASTKETGPGGVDASSVSTSAFGVKLKKTQRPADYDGTLPNLSKPSSTETEPEASFAGVQLKSVSQVKDSDVSTKSTELEVPVLPHKALKKVEDGPAAKELSLATETQALDHGKSGGLAIA